MFPCLGAALIIHTGQNGDTIVSKALSFGVFVFIGLISYSLYLWHWPIFAFAQNYWEHPFNSGEAVILIVSSIAIATASWRYIEQPFRFGATAGTLSRRTYFVGGLGALLLVSCVGLALFLGGGLPGRLNPEVLKFYVASREINPMRSACHTEGAKPANTLRCTTPAIKAGRPYDVLVWGDSHGDALFPGIVMLAQKYGLSVRQATKSACAPLLDFDPSHFGTKDCAAYNDAMVHELVTGPRPRTTVLVARWSLYNDIYQRLDHTIDRLNALGISVLILGQTPEFSSDPNTCFIRRAMTYAIAKDCLRQSLMSANSG